MNEFELRRLERDRSERLLAKGVSFFGNGLSDAQIHSAERIVGSPFPDDLKLFLSRLEDPQRVFFDWVNVSSETYSQIMAWVLTGVLFDVEHNVFWHDSLGERPSNIEEAKNRVREHFQLWPKLAPIYGHRFLPVEPLESGNPVLSIMQTDIIAYGVDLSDYLKREFRLAGASQLAPQRQLPKPIPIWFED